MNPELDKSQELISGLRNALERGESLEMAKQSFVNAGYNKKDIEMAAKQVSDSRIISPLVQQSISKTENFKSQSDSQIPSSQQPRKKTSKTLIIVLIIISVLVLIGSSLLGLYWEKIFGG